MALTTAFRTRRVTLSFDNGPVPGVTERVLEILDRHQVKATFFAIGHLLETPATQALIQQIHSAGHWLGNHTYSHAVAFGDRTDAAFAAQEIELAQQQLGALAPAKLFRPFGNYGLLGPHIFSSASLNHLRDNGYTTVLWDHVPGDWRDPQGWVESCLPQIGQYEWSVPVLHDIADASVHRLSDFITRLADAGVEIVQDFPEHLIATRDGQFLNVPEDLVRDAPPAGQRPWATRNA